MTGILNNLLEQALTVIPGQHGQYMRFKSRTTNDAGQYVNKYFHPQKVYGSFQPVPRTLYEAMGLDYKKVYWMLFTTTVIKGLKRTKGVDRVMYSGMTFDVETEGGWQPVDGWGGLMMVKVEND